MKSPPLFLALFIAAAGLAVTAPARASDDAAAPSMPVGVTVLPLPNSDGSNLDAATADLSTNVRYEVRLLRGKAVEFSGELLTLPGRPAPMAAQTYYLAEARGSAITVREVRSGTEIVLVPAADVARSRRHQVRLSSSKLLGFRTARIDTSEIQLPDVQHDSVAYDVVLPWDTAVTVMGGPGQPLTLQITAHKEPQ